MECYLPRRRSVVSGFLSELPGTRQNYSLYRLLRNRRTSGRRLPGRSLRNKWHVSISWVVGLFTRSNFNTFLIVLRPAFTILDQKRRIKGNFFKFSPFLRRGHL